MELVQFNKARHELSLATKIDEVKNIRDKAEALRAYIKQTGESLEMQNQCAEIKIRAERRAGEILKEQEKNPGGQAEHESYRSHDETSRTPKLSDIGISKSQSSHWQATAEIPEEEFEAHITETKEKKKELTSSGIHKVAQKCKQKDKHDNFIPAELPQDKFQILYADPPWRYDFSETTSREIENQYPTMSLDEIKGLSIPNICADDCVLFLWATSPKLIEGLEVLKAWGFKYVTCAVWDKQKIGMGYYFRQQHEILLVGKKGTLPVPDPSNRVSSVISSPREKHSKKPDIVYEIIEQMYPNEKKIELFNRQVRSGWNFYGNEN